MLRRFCFDIKINSDIVAVGIFRILWSFWLETGNLIAPAAGILLLFAAFGTTLGWRFGKHPLCTNVIRLAPHDSGCPHGDTV